MIPRYLLSKVQALYMYCLFFITSCWYEISCTNGSKYQMAGRIWRTWRTKGIWRMKSGEKQPFLAPNLNYWAKMRSEHVLNFCSCGNDTGYTSLINLWIKVLTIDILFRYVDAGLCFNDQPQLSWANGTQGGANISCFTLHCCSFCTHWLCHRSS